MQIEAAFDPEPMRRLRQETRELLPVRHVAVIESSISPSNERVTTRYASGVIDSDQIGLRRVPF